MNQKEQCHWLYKAAGFGGCDNSFELCCVLILVENNMGDRKDGFERCVTCRGYKSFCLTKSGMRDRRCNQG